MAAGNTNCHWYCWRFAVCSPCFRLTLFYEEAWLYKGFLPSNFLVRENRKHYHTIIPALVNILSLL
jgi:hypothetical protein